MRVHLDYGSDGLDVDVPDDLTDIVTPRHEAANADPRRALAAALAAPIGTAPLATLVRPGQRLAISVCDITRAQPRQLMLEALFAAMPAVAPADVTILVATGTHRANTPDELARMLGPEIAARYRVVNHDARDDAALAFAGRTASACRSGSIATGSTPTSGSPPALSNRTSSPASAAGRRWWRQDWPAWPRPWSCTTPAIGHPSATWGITEGNPVHDDVRAIARLTGVTFAVDVALNRDQRSSGCSPASCSPSTPPPAPT